MKRKISLLIVFMFCVVTLFTGCNLFSINQGKYLNEVIVECGDIQITKLQLLNTYNNYSSQFQQNNFSSDQAVNYCINLLLNREIMLLEADSTVTLSQEEKNQALTDTYDFVIEQIGEYETEILKERGEEIPVTPEAETDTTVVYNPYQPTIEWIDNEIKKITDTSITVDAHYGYNNKVEGFYIYYVPENDELSELAVSRYIRDLKSYEEYKKLSKNNDEVLGREIDRILEIELDNAKLAKMQINYNDNIIASISADNVLAEYNRLVNENKSRYDVEDIGMDAYVSDMLGDASSVYYHPVEKEFFYVTHVLLQYNDEQQAQIAEKKAILEDKGMTQESFDAFCQQVAVQITIDGKVASEILSEIQSAVSEGASLEEKARIFNQFIYTHNSDPGIQNATKDYVIGRAVDEDKESRSKMVVPFTEASRQLCTNYDNYLLGDGTMDVLSGLVSTEYGYHIILFTGYADNMDISTNVIEGSDNLNSYNVNAHTNETYLQHIFDQLFTRNSSYTTYQQGIISAYTNANKVVKYPSKYKEFK